MCIRDSLEYTSILTFNRKAEDATLSVVRWASTSKVLNTTQDDCYYFLVIKCFFTLFCYVSNLANIKYGKVASLERIRVSNFCVLIYNLKLPPNMQMFSQLFSK